MTTVFTLPVLEFPRYDPTTLEPSGTGNLKMNYVFSIISKHQPKHVLTYYFILTDFA
jgi:hypothetical protein